MSKIKFSKKNADFVNELRSKVKEYFELNKRTRYGNSNLLIKSVFMVLLYFGPYFLMISGFVTSIQALFLCWVIMGTGKAGIGMGIMHDANHGAYARNSTLNSIMSKSIYLVGGFPPNWRYQHNTLHHGYTNIDGHDEDIDPAGILRFSPHKPLKKYHKYQHLYAWALYGLMTLTWSIDKDFKQLLNYKKAGISLSKNRKYGWLLTDLIFNKMLYHITFLLIPILLLPVAWYMVIIMFLSMHFVSGFILAIIFQTAHVMPQSTYPQPDENGNIENHWAVHQLYTTSDYSPKSKLFSWLIGGLNYQIEHHLFPNISHIHYKHIAKLVRATAQKYQLPYNVQDNFIKALVSHFKMLKTLGRDQFVTQSVYVGKTENIYE